MMKNFGSGSATLCEREKDHSKKSRALHWGMLGVLLVLVCSGTVSAAVPGQTWTRVNASAAWSDRSNFQTVVFNNKMWVIGGYSDTDAGSMWYNDTWSSSDGKIWTLVNASAAWSARADHQVVVFKDKMWVLGGKDGGFPTNDIWSSSDGKIWTLVNLHSDWSARDRFQAVVFDNKMWVLGGYPGWVNPSDVWSSTDGSEWIQVTPSASWSTRSDNAVVVYANKIWDLGGMTNDTWSSTDGNIWTLVNPSANWSERSWHRVVTFDNKMWVLGGDSTDSTDSGYMNDTWSSSDGNIWTRVNAKAPWPARAYFQAVTFNNKMWVLGGHDGDGRLNDVWSSDQLVPPAIINLNIQPNPAVVINGTQTELSVILNSAQQGISGYNITIVLSNQTVGKIVGITYPAWASMTQNSVLPAGQAWIRAVDMNGASGRVNVTLFNITVRAEAPGSSAIQILAAATKIEDRLGGKYYLPSAIQGWLFTGLFQVQTDRKPFPIPQPIGGFFPLSSDPNRDRKYEDLDGNGLIGFNDVVLMFGYLDDIGAGSYGQTSYYDFDGNGDIGFNDIVRLNGYL